MPSFWENLKWAGETEHQDMHGAEGADMAMYVSHPLPSAGTSFPVVIVAQEAFGVNDHIQKVCDQYAAEGYVAVAPVLYWREHPNPQLGYSEEDMQIAINRYMAALDDDQLVEDIDQVVRWTQGDQFRRTNGQKIGIVGYCVGGRIAYLAATRCQGLSAASDYYGGRILAPFGDGPAPIDITTQIQIPVRGNFGGQDQNPTPDDVATIEAKLKECGVTYDFKMYDDAGHGFNCNDRASYNEAAATDAFSRTVGWFNKYLK